MDLIMEGDGAQKIKCRVDASYRFGRTPFGFFYINIFEHRLALFLQNKGIIYVKIYQI